jgi:hypothetical protein
MPPLRSRQAVAAPVRRYLCKSAIVLAGAPAALSATGMAVGTAASLLAVSAPARCRTNVARGGRICCSRADARTGGGPSPNSERRTRRCPPRRLRSRRSGSGSAAAAIRPPDRAPSPPAVSPDATSPVGNTCRGPRTRCNESASTARLSLRWQCRCGAGRSMRRMSPQNRTGSQSPSCWQYHAAGGRAEGDDPQALPPPRGPPTIIPRRSPGPRRRSRGPRPATASRPKEVAPAWRRQAHLGPASSWVRRQLKW